MCTETQSKLLSNLSKQIPDTNKNDLDKPISSDELIYAIKQMAENKSPGLDGLPKEFYETFWETIEDHITELYNHILFTKKQLSTTQQIAIISLIPKKDDLTAIKN